MPPKTTLVAALLLGLLMPTHALRILLIGPVLPWMFGPYSAQLQGIGHFFQQHGHETYWLPFTYARLDPSKAYTADGMAKAQGVPGPPTVGFRADFAAKTTFVCVRQWAPSQVNKLVSTHDIDVIISLCDLDRLGVDGEFTVPAIAWYPNHFNDLPKMDRRQISPFTKVAALSPSDATMLQGRLPNAKVEWVPHFMDIPEAVLEADKKALRREYGVPEDAFVVLMSCGNYDTQNRKSLDVSLLAFKALRETHPNAFLFMRVISIAEIAKAESKPIPPNTNPASLPQIHLDLLLEAVDLPADSFQLYSQIGTYETSLRVIRMADVLLQPSKAEGFAMPVLEAQALGVPVVTTKFGAMGDYTMNGYSVPPASLHFFVRAFAAYPNVTGVIEALRKVADGEIPSENRTLAQSFIAREMSLERVGNKFLSMLPDEDEALKAKKHRAHMNALPSVKIFHQLKYGSLDYETGHVPNTRVEKLYEYVLIMSSKNELEDTEAFEKVLDEIAPMTPKVDAILIRTRDEHGKVYPTAQEIKMGLLHSELTVCVRMALFAPYLANSRLKNEPHEVVTKAAHAFLVAGVNTKMWEFGMAHPIKGESKHDEL